MTSRLYASTSHANLAKRVSLICESVVGCTALDYMSDELVRSLRYRLHAICTWQLSVAHEQLKHRSPRGGTAHTERCSALCPLWLCGEPATRNSQRETS